MKSSIKKSFAVMLCVVSTILFSLTAFAESEGVRYPMTPTVTPIRIFFAILVIVLFIVAEIGFEKIRNYRIDKRNKNSHK